MKKLLFLSVLFLVASVTKAQTNGLINGLKWVAEGSVSADTIKRNGGRTFYTYSLDSNVINNNLASPDFTTDMPIVWGYVFNSVFNDTVDFEILIDTFKIDTGIQITSGNVGYDEIPDNSISIDQDSLMDFNTTIYSSNSSNFGGLYNVVGIIVNFYQYKSRSNDTLSVGSGGTPREVVFGLGAPNHTTIGVTNLAASEAYTIKNLNSTTSPDFIEYDTCRQIEVIDLAEGDTINLDTIEFYNEDIDTSWLGSADRNSDYPYNSDYGLLYHTYTAADTCGSSGSNSGRLETDDARYNILLEKMSSISIRRRDIKKRGNHKTGVQSALGMVVVLDSTIDYESLPVELIALNATRLEAGNNIQVNWVTASELDNVGFEVQYSFDGIEFTSSSFVSGNGTTNSISDYTTIIENIGQTKTVYIRLKQLDFDGKTAILGPVRVASKRNILQRIIISPNPSSYSFEILNTDEMDAAKDLELFDIHGKPVLLDVIENRSSISVSTSHLIEGVYILRMGSVFTKVVVRR